MPGFISELWHLNQDSDLGPNSPSGVPQGTTTAVSSVFEQHLCRNNCWKMSSKDIFLTFSNNRWNPLDWKPSLVVEYLGQVTGQRAKCTSHLLAKTWCSWSQRAAGSLTCPGLRSHKPGTNWTTPDWRSARVSFNETEATPKAGISVLTSEHLCHTVGVMRAEVAPKQPLFL